MPNAPYSNPLAARKKTMNRQFRLNITTGVLTLVIGIISLLIKEDLYQYFGFIPFIVLTFGIMLILVGVAQLLNIYVKGGFGNKNMIESRMFREELNLMRNEFYHQFDKLANIKGDEEKIKQQITDTVNQISKESLLNFIDNRYKTSILEEKAESQIAEEFNDVKYRLERETSRLSRYGLINLMLGFITTFMAIFFLAYSLSDFNSTTSDTTSFIYKFAPRLSLSVLIELFSFFFLRMYKKTLDDLKYLNNERTNIDLQLLSLRIALLQKDKESISKIILNLSLTERNFILKKDESTVETQKIKLENQSNDHIWGKVLEILNKNSSS